MIDIKRKVSAQGVIPTFSFILEKGSGFVGTVIKDVTHGCYTHVEIVTDHVFWKDKLIHYTVGARPAGIKISTMKYLWAEGSPTDFDIFIIPSLRSDQVGNALDYLESILFRPYDYPGLFHFLPVIGHLFKPRPNDFICSEAAARACGAAGFLPPEYDFENCSPVTFAKLPFLQKVTVEV